MMHYDRSTNDFIFEVDGKVAFAIANGEKELSDIVRVERGRLSG